MAAYLKYLSNSVECMIEATYEPQWLDLGKVILPGNESLTLNQLYNSAKVIVLCQSNTSLLLPGTIIYLYYDTWANGRFWVVKNSSFERKIYQTLELEELLTAFRNIFLEPLFFSQGKYTVETFFNRLFAIAKTEYSFYLAGDIYEKLNSSWKCPDLQVNSNNLLDAIMQFSRSAYVKPIVSLTGGTVSEQQVRFRIEFIPLEGLAANNNFNKILADSKELYLGENIASEVYSIAHNLVAKEKIWYPTDTKRGASGILPEVEQYETEVTNESCVIVLPFKIRKAYKLRASGFGRAGELNESEAAGSFFWQVLPDGRTNYLGNTKMSWYPGRKTDMAADEFDIYEEKDWAVLDEVTRVKTPYYVEDTNIIKNINGLVPKGIIYYSWGASQTDFPPAEMIAHPESFNKTSYYQSFNDAKNCRFSVLYEPYMDTLITSKNGLQNNKAVLYGQNENVVDGTEFIHNLDNYIHSLESGDVVRYCLYDKYSDIPQLGTISEFGIINSISITVNQTKFMAIFACNNEYISKSEFLSADNSIQLSTIVKEDAFERLSNYYEEIYITVDPQKAQKIQNTKSGIKQPIFFCDALDEVHRNQTEKTPSIAEIKTDGDRYTGANISFGILGNNYVFNFKSINNYLIGNQRQGNYVFPVPYVVNRVTNSLGFKLKKIIDVYSFLTSYPILTSTEYLDDFDTIYEKQNGTFLKDESESINVTTQIQMKGLGNSRVFESFLQNSSLYKNTTRNGPLEWIPIDNLAVCLYESKQSQYSDLRNYVEQFNITDAVYSIENGILKCEITIGINIIDTSVYKYVSVINLSKNEFYFYVDEPLPEGYTNKLSIYFPIKG